MRQNLINLRKKSQELSDAIDRFKEESMHFVPDDSFDDFDDSMHSYILDICEDQVTKKMYPVLASKYERTTPRKILNETQYNFEKVQYNFKKSISMIGDCIQEKYRNIQDEKLQKNIRKRMSERREMAKRWKAAMQNVSYELDE